MLDAVPSPASAPEPAAAPATLLLIDGSSYLYRAFHAMPDLRADPADPSSPPTGAIRGFVNMMQALKKEVPAAYVACVFDAKGPTFRDAIYPQYKANRSPMPDDLRAQIQPIHELARLLGMKVLDVPGVEADDVIGTLAHRAAAQGWDVVVSSGDKDLAQLVTERIVIIDTMNGKRRDLAGVEAEFGIPPSLMLDYQNLVGDTVDNVPGVSKVGPKTAVKWLLEYGSLQAVIDNAHQIKGVVGDNLRAALDWLPTARSLLTIKIDCELSGYLPQLPGLDDLVRLAPDQAGLLDFYTRYGFKGLAKSAQESAAPAAATPGAAQSSLFGDASAQAVQQLESDPDYSYETVLDWMAFDAWMTWWRWIPRPRRCKRCRRRSWASACASQAARRRTSHWPTVLPERLSSCLCRTCWCG